MVPRDFRSAKGSAINRLIVEDIAKAQSRRSGCCATRELVRVTSNSTIVQCHAVLLRRVPIDGVGGIQL
jgi:hypothetical protein